MMARTISKPCKKNLARSLFRALAIVTLMIHFPASTYAQSLYGTITGSVTDPSGAIVPGASVTATSIATNEKRTIETDAAGSYRLVDLLPGQYRIDVEANGFKRLSRDRVMLEVGSELRIDGELSVGSSTETVTVEASTPQLETESASQSDVVEGKVVQEMPLNGRNVLNLLALAQGVVPQGGSEGSAGMNEGTHTDQNGWGNFQIGGSFGGQSGEYVDEGPINTLGGNAVGLIPTQESIQEFRVAVNLVSPEYGRFSGGVVEMTTKSGSNAWHGSLYEYFRNTVLNANNFFLDYYQEPKQKFRQNQYGALVSGPIKKDRVFFMANWEDFSLRFGVPYEFNVPTADQRAGKFYGETIGIPGAGGPAPAGCVTQGLQDAKGSYSYINPSCFDPTTKVELNYFPLPNTVGGAYNYVSVPTTSSDNSQYTGRIDYNIGSKQRFYGRYTYWRLHDDNPSFLQGTQYATGYSGAEGRTQQTILGDAYVFNPTTVLDVNASYLREKFSNLPPSYNAVDESQFGAAYGAMAGMETFQTLPNLLFAGADNLPTLIPMDVTAIDTNNNLAFRGNLSKTIGQHDLRIGGEVRYMDKSGFGNNLESSTLSVYVGGPWGDELASFLLGEPVSTTIQTNQFTATYNISQGYYISDAWQVTSHLALNAGLRWELPGGMFEKNDRTTVLLPNEVDPVLQQKGYLALVNSSAYPSRSMIPVRYNLFAPRVGFAESLDNATVIRGGYGINYLPPDLLRGVLSVNSPVNSFTTSTNPMIYAFSYHAVDDPFNVLSGRGIGEPVGRTSPNWTQSLIGQAVEGVVPSAFRASYMQQWNLSFSHQWLGEWLTELSYLGAKGSDLPEIGATLNNNLYFGIDQVDDAELSYWQGQENACAGNATCISNVESNGTAALQPKRPFYNAGNPSQQYQDVHNTGDTTGDSIYHGLIARLQKRFHSAGVLNVNYTWSKLIADTDGLNSGAENNISGYIQDFTSLHGERSISNFDIPHRVVIDYVVPLPFGGGQRYADFSGIAGALVSGWSVNGITTFSSGTPLGLWYSGSSTNQQTNLGTGNVRPNYTQGCRKTSPGSSYQHVIEGLQGTGGWFNTSCFTSPGDFGFGNEPRVDGSLRAQGADNYDFSVVKGTRIKDTTDVQLRFEFFNLFNRPQFLAPVSQVDGSDYGRSTSLANNPRLVQVSARINF